MLVLDEMAARARRLADREAEQRAREAAADEAWAALRARAEALGVPIAPAVAGVRSRSIAARGEALDRRATALDDYRESLESWRARLDAAAAERADLDALRARLMRTLSAEIAELGPVDLARIVGRALGEHTGPLAPVTRPIRVDTPRGDVAQEALLLAYWADAEDSGDTDIGADDPPSEPTPSPHTVAALFESDPPADAGRAPAADRVPGPRVALTAERAVSRPADPAADRAASARAPRRAPTGGRTPSRPLAARPGPTAERAASAAARPAPTAERTPSPVAARPDATAERMPSRPVAARSAPTTDRTVSAAARPTPTTDRTASAAARPTPTTDRTASAVARPTPATDRTANAAAARPTPATDRTASAAAARPATTDRTASAAARPTPTTDRTANAAARTTSTTDRTASAAAPTTPTTDRTASAAPTRPAPTAERTATALTAAALTAAPTAGPLTAADPDPTPLHRPTLTLEAARIDDYSIDALDLGADPLPPASAETIAAEIDAWRADGQTDGELSIDGRLDADIAAEGLDGLAAWLGHSDPPAAAPLPEPAGEPVDAIVEPLGDDSLLQWEAAGLGADVDRLVESRARGSATTVLEVLEDPFAAFAAGSSANDSEPFGFTDLSSDASSHSPAPAPAAGSASLAPGSLLAPFGDGAEPARSEREAEALLFDDPFDDSSFGPSVSVAALDSALDGPFGPAAEHGAFGHSLGTVSGPDGDVVDFDAAFRDAFAGVGGSSLDSLDSLDVVDDPFPDAGGSRPRDPRLAVAFGEAAPALGSVEGELARLGAAPIPPPLGGVGFDLEAAIAAAEPRDAAADFGDALSPLDEVAPRAFESFESVDASWTGWPTPLGAPDPAPAAADAPRRARADFEAPRRADFELPRRPDFEPPRARDFESPRARDFESPRRPDFESPRAADSESSRARDFEPPRRPDFDSPRRPDFEPPRPDFEPPRSADFESPRPAEPPRSPDFESPRPADFEPPRSPDFESPIPADFEPPRHPDFEPSPSADFEQPHPSDFESPPAALDRHPPDFEPAPAPRAAAPIDPEPHAPDISEDRFEVDPLDIDIAFAELDRPTPPPLPPHRAPLPETATLADALDAARADATAWAEPSTNTRFERLLDALHAPEPPDEHRRVTARFQAIARDVRPAAEPEADPWAALGMGPHAAADPLPAIERRRRGVAPAPADLRPRVSPPRPLASEELAPRAPLAVRVGLETGDQFFTGFSTDISVSGIFVECARTLPVGRSVEVFFELPGGHSVSAEARVQRVRDGKDGRKPGLGIAFRSLVREDRVRVGRYVAQQLTGKIPRL